jgi:hypothetical protein
MVDDLNFRGILLGANTALILEPNPTIPTISISFPDKLLNVY